MRLSLVQFHQGYLFNPLIFSKLTGTILNTPPLHVSRIPLYTTRVYKESASPAGFGVHISRNQVFIGLFGGDVYRKKAPRPHIAVHTSSVQWSLVPIVRIIPYLCSPFRPLRGPAIALVVKW